MADCGCDSVLSWLNSDVSRLESNMSDAQFDIRFLKSELEVAEDRINRLEAILLSQYGEDSIQDVMERISSKPYRITTSDE